MSEQNPTSALAAALTTPPPAAPATPPATGAETPPPAPPPPAPQWLTGLPEDLRGSEHLARYQSIEDLAKAHIETTNWARGRIPIPRADDAKSIEDFVAKARPEKWEDYKIDLAEGADTARADGFKQKAHELGLMPWQVEKLAAFDQAYMTDLQSKLQKQAVDELKTREVNMGPAGYNRALLAIDNMLASAGVTDLKAVDALSQVAGAGVGFDLLAHFAKVTGELDKVGGHDLAMAMGAATPQSAQAEIDRLMLDREFMAKVGVPGSAEAKRWADLNAAAAGV